MMSLNIKSSLNEDIFSEIAKSIRFSLNSSKMSFSSSVKLNFNTLYFGIKPLSFEIKFLSIKSPNHVKGRPFKIRGDKSKKTSQNTLK